MQPRAGLDRFAVHDVGQIADLAFEFKVGARSLRGIFEEMITPVLYVVPDRPEVRKVVIRSLFEEAVFS